MKGIKFLLGTCFLLTLTMLLSCGGDSSSSVPEGLGTASIYLTDAKPALPDDIKNVFITIDEFLVHKSGGGWQNMPLVETPYRIDLLQFREGVTTEFVPPTLLTNGQYTQVRMLISNAEIVLGDDTSIPLYIPSEKLRTDQNFVFDVGTDAAVDIVIDFDLSQSLVKTGNKEYKINPVLHINEASIAATLNVKIANDNFVDGHNAIVKVIALSNNEEYTEIEVEKSGSEDPTTFNIYWLVPNQSYEIVIDFDSDGLEDTGPIPIDAGDLKNGEIVDLQIN